jgi:hypothetical protein
MDMVFTEEGNLNSNEMYMEQEKYKFAGIVCGKSTKHAENDVHVQ